MIKGGDGNTEMRRKRCAVELIISIHSITVLLVVYVCVCVCVENKEIKKETLGTLP